MPSCAGPRQQPGAVATATPVAAPLEEVVVASSRFRLADDSPLERTFLTQAELEALPRLADDSLKAVHRLPAAASNGFSGLAYIRGGEQSETLVVLDGLAMYEPFHLRLVSSPTSVLDPRILDSLEVFAGGFTAEFGDRISSVIDARSTQPDADRYYEAGLSLFHTNALASMRFAGDRGQWLLSARRSNLDFVSEMAKSEIGKPSYFDGFGRLDFAFSDATSASLHMLFATDKSSLRNDEDTERADADYSNSYVWGTLDHRWSPALSSSLLLSYSDVTANRIGDRRRPGPARRASSTTTANTMSTGRGWTPATRRSAGCIELGVEFRSLSATYRYSSRITLRAGIPVPGRSRWHRRARAGTVAVRRPHGCSTQRAGCASPIASRRRWASAGTSRPTAPTRTSSSHRASTSRTRRPPTTRLRASWGRVPAGAEHQRAAGRGRCRRSSSRRSVRT